MGLEDHAMVSVISKPNGIEDQNNIYRVGDPTDSESIKIKTQDYEIFEIRTAMNEFIGFVRKIMKEDGSVSVERDSKKIPKNIETIIAESA